jgi:hypothetical protein
MRLRILLAAALFCLVLVGGLVVWPRVEFLCLEGGPATELALADGRVSVEGRTYVVKSYVSADYGAYLFPASVLRGHPVAVGVFIRGTDDAPLSEVTPSCIGIQHDRESIERRARTAVRNESRADGSPYVEMTSGISDLPEWKPGDTVRVWLRLAVRGRAYVLDVGETMISSVG